MRTLLMPPSRRDLNLPIQSEKFILIALATSMTLLSTFALRDIGEPRPQMYMLANGFILALILNVGLWLAALTPYRYLRLPISLYLIPESIGIGIILWYWHWSFGIIGLTFHLALAYRVFKGKRLL